MNRTKKPYIYVEKQMFRTLTALDKLNKHINNTKRLNKTQVRILVEEIKEPLMRAYGYVFPDEEI